MEIFISINVSFIKQSYKPLLYNMLLLLRFMAVNAGLSLVGHNM